MSGEFAEPVQEYALDVALVIGGALCWLIGGMTGSALGVNIGFLSIAIVVATRMGWV